MEKGGRRFRLAIITNKDHDSMKIITQRTWYSKYFDYDVLESMEQIQALKEPTEYEAVFVIHLQSKLKMAQIPNMVEELIRKSPKLVWAHSMAVGIDLLLCDTLIKSTKISLTNARGAYNSAMAEYSLMTMLYFSQNLQYFTKEQAEHKYLPRSFVQLRGCTVGIVGYGSLGNTIANILKTTFQAKILGVRKSSPYSEEDKKLLDFAGFIPDMPKVLSESDYVFNLLPSTEETKNIFDLKLFKLMKPTGVYINLGRGTTNKEEDLIEALKSGVIAGAALDVYQTEPLPPTSPLYDAPNLLITPHVSGFCKTYWENCLSIFEKEMFNFVEGRPFSYVVI